MRLLSCECKRDGLLAMEMGLKGKLLPILPNTGGFEVNKYSKIRQNNPTSSRRLILLKGNQGWAGRALLGLQAIELCKEELSGYIIAIYSAGDEVKREANNLSERINVPIKIIPPCSHEEIMGIFGKSRVYIGLSITDAISTSLLEAIMMGTFPIQTNTSCASEWIIDGETGFIVPPDNPQIIAKKISKAISDDELVDKASEINFQTATKRLDISVIKPNVIETYNNILSGTYTGIRMD